MLNTLIIYGPTGKNLPPDKIGGGERGCQRTIQLYKSIGVEVLVVEKPTLGRGMWNFLYDSFFTPFRLIHILFCNKEAPIHIVGFYENQLFYEYMIFRIAKMFHRKITYELRNGTMVKTFNKHSWLYKRWMRTIVEKSVCVLCQGWEYVLFINEHWKARPIYYPNYVLNKYVVPYNEGR